MIWEELKESLIFIDLKADTYEEVFEKMGGEFIRQGYAKETYIDGLKEREAEFPTGIDVDGFAIAIPHTPVIHVNRTGTAIGILNKPVTFHEMGGDEEDTVEARLVIMLCVDNPSAHIDKLQKIIEMIQDKEFLGSLTKATTEIEVIKLFEEKEKTL